MISDVLTWATAHPIDSLLLMVLFALLLGFGGISPEIRQHLGRSHHPRC